MKQQALKRLKTLELEKEAKRRIKLKIIEPGNDLVLLFDEDESDKDLADTLEAYLKGKSFQSSHFCLCSRKICVFFGPTRASLSPLKVGGHVVRGTTILVDLTPQMEHF